MEKRKFPICHQKKCRISSKKSRPRTFAARNSAESSPTAAATSLRLSNTRTSWLRVQVTTAFLYNQTARCEQLFRLSVLRAPAWQRSEIRLTAVKSTRRRYRNPLFRLPRFTRTYPRTLDRIEIDRNHVLDSGTKQATMKFLAICLLGIFVLPSVRPQKTQSSSPVSACHEFAFDGRISGGAEYSHELGGGLLLRLNPAKENWGWVIQIQPRNSNEDYAWPVNPPFHFGNSQWLATGYNESAQQQLSHEHEVFFVLDKAEYERATKLANDALNSSDPEAAGKFLVILPTLRSAVLKLKPTNYKTTNEGKSVSWMRFSVSVTAPASFQPTSGIGAKNIACP
jgi:hypothetical protein